MKSRVLVEVKDGVAVVTLNRSEKKNALDLDLLNGLVNSAREIQRNKDVRAVILTGAGDDFSAGLDFQSVMKKPFRVLPAIFKFGGKTNLFQEVAWCWRKLPVPVIAVIRGHCLGGGFQIALGADFRFATEDSQFSIMEAKWGLVPDMSATVTLRELISMDLAKELTMTARVFDGRKAKEYGLVTRVCGDPMAEAWQLIEEIKTRSPDSVVASKKLFHQTWNASVRRAFAVETWIQTCLLLGKNQRIAMSANFKKENPRFLPRK